MEKDQYDQLPLPNRRLYDLIVQQTGGNVSKFAKIVGISQQSLQRLFFVDKRSGEYPSLSNNITNKVCNLLGVSQSYFYADEDDKVVPNVNIPTDAIIMGVPFYDDAYFGCSPSGFSGALMQTQAAGYFRIPGIESDGSTFIVRARGNSMEIKNAPDLSIPNGAYVAIRKTNLSTPQWGEVYAISTDDGCIIKRLYPSERENCVKCVSYNDEYPAFELRQEEIHDIGVVTAVININLFR